MSGTYRVSEDGSIIGGRPATMVINGQEVTGVMMRAGSNGQIRLEDLMNAPRHRETEEERAARKAREALPPPRRRAETEEERAARKAREAAKKSA